MNIFRRLTQHWNPAALRLALFPGTAADVQEAVEWEQPHRA